MLRRGLASCIVVLTQIFHFLDIGEVREAAAVSISRLGVTEKIAHNATASQLTRGLRSLRRKGVRTRARFAMSRRTKLHQGLHPMLDQAWPH